MGETGRMAGTAAFDSLFVAAMNPCGPLQGCHMASVLPSVRRLADGGACRPRSVTARTRVGPSARTATYRVQHANLQTGMLLVSGQAYLLEASMSVCIIHIVCILNSVHWLRI